jgi:ribonucleotide reductase beta subunit family protein with ferritin-like domain
MAAAETHPLTDLDPVRFAPWRVRSRDERFRTFEPQRIAVALGKALRAADGSDELPAGRAETVAKLTRQVCDDLVARQPTGGSFYIEEIQDQAELALMRAGEHEAARRFVLYRENRRKARADAETPEVAGLDALLGKLADPLVTENLDRFVLFPIEHHDLWKAFKDHLSLMWTAEEIDLAKDQQDWKKLTDGERYFLSHVLAFFAASDGIVNENLAARFYREITASEARAYYSMQMLIETVHSETYSLLIDTYIASEEERRRLFNAVETVQIVGDKARWALNWLENTRPLAERLVAFACVEGIFFSSSFCAVYWIKDMKQGMLPGLCFSNELISRDEGMHTDFAVMMHNKLQEKCSPERIRAIVAEAVEIECRFATEALPVSLIGMNADSMQQYIRFVADRLLTQLGCERAYNVRCPFDFMERIGLQNKTNFHEKKVAEYRRAGVGISIAEQKIAFDVDF